MNIFMCTGVIIYVFTLTKSLWRWDRLISRASFAQNGWFGEIYFELKWLIPRDQSRAQNGPFIHVLYIYTPAGSRAPSYRSSINNITISANIKLWRVTRNLGKQITWTNIVRHFFLLNSKHLECKKIYLSMSIQIVECSGAKTTPLGREMHKYKMEMTFNRPFYHFI